MNNTDKFSESIIKKIKYGSASAAFTAVFIALVIIINSLTTAVHLTRPMIIDMSGEKVFTLSDATREILADVSAPVEIVFLLEPDRYMQLGNFGEGLMVVNLINAFADEFENITVSVANSNRDPAARMEFQNSDLSNIRHDSIGIRCGGLFRALTLESFFTFDSAGYSSAAWEAGAIRPFAFRGERQLASAILQLTSTETPRVYFTEGHGEDEPAELMNIFATAGYLVERINLNEDEIHEDTSVIVIHNPRRDFNSATADNPAALSEIDKLHRFLGSNFGSLIYFAHQDSPPLPVLESLLAEYGLGIDHGVTVIDPKSSIAGSAGREIIAEFASDSPTAIALHENISNLPSLTRVIVPNARPVRLIENPASGYLNSLAVVLSASEAGEVLREGEVIRSGKIPLMAVSARVETVANELRTALVLVCGSGTFSAPTFMGSPAFSNSDIIYNATRVLGQRRVLLDGRIDKPLDVHVLPIDAASAVFWSTAFMVVLPLAVIVLGIFVWVKRRHS